mmetsp:Transcript_19544/g.56022  ORF Transcript_19544/g.56022 Transcript_19544/m.56022 type:complete len:540 (+) Transcript_19544:426-2045(+)
MSDGAGKPTCPAAPFPPKSSAEAGGCAACAMGASSNGAFGGTAWDLHMGAARGGPALEAALLIVPAWVAWAAALAVAAWMASMAACAAACPLSAGAGASAFGKRAPPLAEASPASVQFPLPAALHACAAPFSESHTQPQPWPSPPPQPWPSPKAARLPAAMPPFPPGKEASMSKPLERPAAQPEFPGNAPLPNDLPLPVSTAGPAPTAGHAGAATTELATAPMGPGAAPLAPPFAAAPGSDAPSPTDHPMPASGATNAASFPPTRAGAADAADVPATQGATSATGMLSFAPPLAAFQPQAPLAESAEKPDFEKSLPRPFVGMEPKLSVAPANIPLALPFVWHAPLDPIPSKEAEAPAAGAVAAMPVDAKAADAALEPAVLRKSGASTTGAASAVGAAGGPPLPESLGAPVPPKATNPALAGGTIFNDVADPVIGGIFAGSEAELFPLTKTSVAAPAGTSPAPPDAFANCCDAGGGAGIGKGFGKDSGDEPGMHAAPAPGAFAACGTPGGDAPPIIGGRCMPGFGCCICPGIGGRICWNG